MCEPCSCSTRGLHGCRRRRQFSCCAPHIGRFCCVTWRPWQSLRPPFIWGGPITPGHRRSPRRALNFSPPVLPLVRLLVPTLVRSSAQRLRRFQPAARGLARCGPGPVAGQQRVSGVTREEGSVLGLGEEVCWVLRRGGRGGGGLAGSVMSAGMYYLSWRDASPALALGSL